MHLNGWKRLLIVMSVAWLLLIGVVAGLQYPSQAPSTSQFWHAHKNPFDRFDQTPAGGASTGTFDDLIPARASLVEPNYRAFLTYGLLPPILLWVLYFSFGWVRRGFQSSRA